MWQSPSPRSALWVWAAITPTGFLPEDDQGGLFVVVQLPGASSVARTTAVVEQAEAILRQENEVEDITSVVGLNNFIDNYSQASAAFMVVTLKPFEERKGRVHSVFALIGRLGQKFRAIAGRRGHAACSAAHPWARQRRWLHLRVAGFARRRPEGDGPGAARDRRRSQSGIWHLSRVFSTFSASNPSIYLNIDRDKAQIVGVQLSDIFLALQASLGGYYVNQVNLFGRTWQVQVEAEAADRSNINDIYRINVRNSEGKMISMQSLAEASIVVGPSVFIYRYNNLRAVTVQGSPAAGTSSGQALNAMEAVATHTLPPGYAGVWTDTAFQEKRAEGKTGIILGFAILFRPICSLAGLDEEPNPGPRSVVGDDRNSGIVCGDLCGSIDAGSLRADRHRRSNWIGCQERYLDR